MSTCSDIRDHFSRYLDGDVPGSVMLEISHHLRECRECAQEFAVWQRSQTMVAGLGPSKAPADLALKLRIAISRESSRTPRERLARWRVRWQNSLQPFLLRAAGGLASAIFLVGSSALLIGMFAAPDAVEARDQPLQIATAPHLLYSSFEPGSAIGEASNPLVIQAFVDSSGRVYDYRILSGEADEQTRSSISNLLLFSVFAPARSFDQPVRGSVLMSFSGVSVRG
jgi:predicted anti-sigma-YlaC factor YlaD